MVASLKRVLVVDDEAIVCESYKRILDEAGYSVCTVRSGRDAITACRKEPFDVMLADLKMPDLDGIEVTRMVKEEFPKIQVLIITGYPTRQSAREAQGLGVFDYLCKPLTPERLSAATAAALAFPERHMTSTNPGESANPKEAGSKREETTVFDSTEPEEAGSQRVNGDEEAVFISVMKTLGILVAAPLIGLAYVMLIPLLGFGVVLATIGAGLAKAFGWASS